jgi:hypothetical protein
VWKSCGSTVKHSRAASNEKCCVSPAVEAAFLIIASEIHPCVEVLAAVTGRGMDEAGTRVVGDVIAAISGTAK